MFKNEIKLEEKLKTLDISPNYYHFHNSELGSDTFDVS